MSFPDSAPLATIPFIAQTPTVLVLDPSFDSLSESPLLRVLMISKNKEDFLLVQSLLHDSTRNSPSLLRYSVEWANTPGKAKRRIAQSPRVDICLLDNHLELGNGLEFLGELLALDPRLTVVLLTDSDDGEVDEQALCLRASASLVKSELTGGLLARTVRHALRHSQHREEARRQNEFVSAVLDTAGALVLVLDPQGRIVRFNRRCEQLTGYTFAQIQGAFFWEKLVPAEAQTEVRGVFARLTAGNFPIDFENDWVARDGTRHRIAWSNTALLGEGGQVAFVIATGIDVSQTRRAEQDLLAAREREERYGAAIQKTLLLQQPNPRTDGVTVGAAYRTSQAIGGDFFDVLTWGENYVDVIVGDVMGKGVGAALLAAAAKAQFQRAARRLLIQTAPFGRLPEPQEIVGAVHQAAAADLYAMGSFVTLVYARFDLNRSEVSLIDCGHPRLRRLRPASSHSENSDSNAPYEVVALSGDNLPLGLNPDEQYQKFVFPFRAGDRFVFFSDGITDAIERDGEPFGEKKLTDLLAHLPDVAPHEAAERICQAALSHSRSRALFQTAHKKQERNVSDDATCVVVRINEQDNQPCLHYLAWEFPAVLEELPSVRNKVTQFLIKYAPQLSASERSDWVFAVHESVVSVILNAFAPDQTQPTKQDNQTATQTAQGEFLVFADRVCFRLHDRGKPSTDPNTKGYNERPIPQLYSGMDKIEAHRDDMGRNTLSITKWFRE